MKVVCRICKKSVKGRLVDHYRKEHSDISLDPKPPTNTGISMYDTIRKDIGEGKC